MKFDWHRLQHNSPFLFRAVLMAKSARTMVAAVLVTACVIEGIWFRERPLDLYELGAWVVVGIGMILAGLILRIAALGVLKKKQALATAGIYSLCRHPLYLGSILLTYGFCILLNDGENFLVATVYFAIFYPLTIAWEEIRLEERFGEAHRKYCQSTPLLFPFGRYKEGNFSLRRAMRLESVIAVVVTVLSLVGIECMAEVFRSS